MGGGRGVGSRFGILAGETLIVYGRTIFVHGGPMPRAITIRRDGRCASAGLFGLAGATPLYD